MTTRPVQAGGRIAATDLTERRAVFAALMGALLLSAWALLWLWSESPHGRYLDHGRWSDAGFIAELCRALPAGELLVPALLYATGWVVMIAAMMLPTTLPLLEIFRRITAGRADAGRLLALVVVGYLVAWLVFGLVAHALDLAVHALVRGAPWLTANGWAIGATVVGIAGVFQFSAIKYRCLDKCRTPFSFVAVRWRGAAPAQAALRIGVDHGAFCVGCCWALMLLMFVVGSGNIGWMLVLAAVMAAEKNFAGGRRLSAPLGVALLIWAAAIVLSNG